MTKANISKVIFKNDPMSTDEYIVIVNPETYVSWRNGDKTIPLADVVDSFQIFSSGQGSQGIMGQLSKQELHTVFGTSNADDAIVKVLEEGTLQAGTLRGNDNSGRNQSNAGANITSLGNNMGGR
ncbi:peroxisome-assembly ATPase [Malassezia caprae]|uniref:Peroxisome-assembly ATPase n=1 Tax=Malassezia caprae TaxID=1381934 RepID=A0AAF0E9J3_9BASI|nr:peroxisome-assembly ATPase [Malassezia caprae]